MSIARSSLAACHQSDPSCLARFHFEATHEQPSGHFATIGTLCHRIIEQYTYLMAEHSQVQPMMVVRDVLRAALTEDEVTPEVVEETIVVMAGAFAPESTLRLGLPPSPWRVSAELRWALDEEFRPIAPCPNCEGTKWIDVAGDNPYRALCEAYGNKPCFGGWSAEPAYEGTIDRLEFSPAKVTIRDWKSKQEMPSGLDVSGDRQAKWYSVAALAIFDKVPEVRFEMVMLRHGYAAPWAFKRADGWYEETKANMRARRAKRLQAIETGIWPETLGEDCSYCPILLKCAAQREARENGGVPAGTDSEAARWLVGLKAQVTLLDGHLRRRVAATGPVALEDDDGSVLGRKPVKGSVLRYSYERTMSKLRKLPGWTKEREVEWFRYVRKADMPGRVKKALETLVGKKVARGWIEDGGEWIEQTTEFEFGVHVPPAPAAALPPVTEDALDAMIATATPERLAAALREAFGGGGDGEG